MSEDNGWPYGWRFGALSVTDQKIMEALRDGARTHHIAKAMGWDTPRANRAMRRLESDGIVRRDLPRCAVNDLRWLPLPPAPEPVA